MFTLQIYLTFVISISYKLKIHYDRLQQLIKLAFCLSYKKKGILIAQNLTNIIKAPIHMSHTPLDLVRRDRVMSV